MGNAWAGCSRWNAAFGIVAVDKQRFLNRENWKPPST
jgi:hypothetical protein